MSDLTVMQIGALMAQFSIVPDSARAAFLRQHPEIRSEAVVDWALRAARLRSQVGEPEAQRRYASAALYIATDLGDGERQAAAQALLGERLSDNQPENEVFKGGADVRRKRVGRRTRLLAASAAELSSRPSLRSALRVMLRHPGLIPQAAKTALGFIAAALRNPSAAAARMQRMLEETEDEASLARVHDLADQARSEGDAVTAERLEQLPGEMHHLADRLSSAAARLYALRVYDLVTAVAAAESETDARRIVRDDIALALNPEFLPSLMQARAFWLRQPDVPQELEIYLTLILDEIGRALEEMPAEQLGPGGAATALRLADGPERLEELLTRCLSIAPEALVGALDYMADVAEVRGLADFAEQTRILISMVALRLGPTRAPPEFSQAAAITESLARGEDALVSGRVQEALDRYNAALTLAQAAADPAGEAYARNNLGLIYVRLNRWGEAEQQLEIALNLARQAGDKSLEALALLNLGNALAVGDLPARALDCYAGAAKVAGELHEPALEARALGSRGRVYAAQGYNREALTEYERALTLQREVGDRQGEVATLINMANACARLGSRERAMRCYERSLAIAGEQSDDEATARARAGRALLYVQLGRLEDAQADLQASLAYVEGLRAGLTAEDDRISYFGWDKMDVYRQLVLLLAGRHPRRDTRLALKVVERSRSRAFLDRLAATGAGPGDSPRLDAVGQPASWPQVRSLLGAA